jgi:hypothetical protein
MGSLVSAGLTPPVPAGGDLADLGRLDAAGPVDVDVERRRLPDDRLAPVGRAIATTGETVGPLLTGEGRASHDDPGNPGIEGGANGYCDITGGDAAAETANADRGNAAASSMDAGNRRFSRCRRCLP